MSDLHPLDNELINQALQPDRDPGPVVPCRSCGAKVRVQKDQYTLRCPACGSKIVLSRAYREARGLAEKQEEKGAACPYCHDIGIIDLPVQVDENIFHYAYRCLCAAGRARTETAIPLAVDVDLAPLLRRGRRSS